jgi:DNA-binding beta-propeller fold protein YncE
MLSLPSQKHDIIIYSLRFSGIPQPFCPVHKDQWCDLHCERCDVPVCNDCITSKKHANHEIKKIANIFQTKKDVIVQETKFLEERISLEYERIIRRMENEIRNLSERNVYLKSKIKEQGHLLHTAIDKAVNQRLDYIDSLEKQDLAKLHKSLSEFRFRLNAIRDIIKTNKGLLQTRQSHVINYQPRLPKFSQMPSIAWVTPGSFTSAKVKDEDIQSMIGELVPAKTTAVVEHRALHRIKELLVLVECRKEMLLDKPEVIATIDTNYDELYEVVCLGNNQVWISGDNGTMKRVDGGGGAVLETVKTKSGDPPDGLAVTRDGKLLYADFNDKSINLVNGGKVKLFIQTDWYPSGISCNSLGDILVALCDTNTMLSSTDSKKVVRYNGTSMIQEIQFDEKKQRLFQSGSAALQIAENKLGDIFVVDSNAGAVVITNHQGKLKSPSSSSQASKSEETFYPHYIATGSRGQVLVSDWKNNCVHILNMDGQPLSVIDNCDLRNPAGVSVDSEDRLWVVERDTGKLKIIKYMK